jgi:hypothetical protein
VGAAAEDDRQSLKLKFDRLLDEPPEIAWKDAVTTIHTGPRDLRCDLRLFPDKSKLVFTLKEENGRRATLHFYEFATSKTSEVNLFAREEERALTLDNFLVSPDSKSIWLLIVPVGEQKGHILTWNGYWFRYDVEKGELVRQGAEYKRLVDFSRGVGQDPPRAWPGPVWSLPDRKLYMSEQEARRAGVKRFWRSWESEPPPRHSEIVFEGTAFEMISGMYNKGHVFVKGEYITSVTLATSWLPQDCWFVRDVAGVTLYKFVGYGKRGYWKSHLGERTILRVEDVPDTGVLVSSWDETREFLDLIPLRMPDKGQQQDRAPDSGM